MARHSSILAWEIPWSEKPGGPWVEKRQTRLSTHTSAEGGFPGGSEAKNPPAKAGDAGCILGGGDPLEKAMATHCSILAWKIPWTEELEGYSPWCHKRLRRVLAPAAEDCLQLLGRARLSLTVTSPWAAVSLAPSPSIPLPVASTSSQLSPSPALSPSPPLPSSLYPGTSAQTCLLGSLESEHECVLK